MIAFYAWTDTIILNILNVKKQKFPHEKADLFVLRLDRITPALLDAVRLAEIFERVVVVEEVTPIPLRPRLRWTRKTALLLDGQRRRRHYFSALRSLGVTGRYETFITAAFWADSLYIFQYLRQINPGIEIRFVEEGIANYYLPKKALCRTQTFGGIRELLLRLSNFGLWQFRARRRVCRMYLYRPQLYKGRGIPVEGVQPQRDLLGSVAKNVNSRFDLAAYSAARIIYFASPAQPGQEEEAHRQTRALISLLKKEDGAAICRCHPEMASREPEFIRELSGELAVDPGKNPFELMLFGLDLNRRILVSNGSSAIMYVKLLGDQEPYLLFTHRLNRSAVIKKPEPGESYFQDMLSLYTDKSKIAAPDSYEQCRDIIRRWTMNKEWEEKDVSLLCMDKYTVGHGDKH